MILLPVSEFSIVATLDQKAGGDFEAGKIRLVHGAALAWAGT